MEIKISDYGWGIDRRTGQRNENLLEEVTFPNVKEGDTLEVGEIKHQFIINKIEGNSINMTVNRKGDKVDIKIGEKHTYKPFSFDGGHYYVIEVK